MVKVEAKFVRERITQRIEDMGINPVECPICKTKCMWPESHDAMNSLDRTDQRYICQACGIDQMGIKR